MIDSGYDDDNDLYYIILEKIEDDLNTKIKKSIDKKLNLQTTINVGLELVFARLLIIIVDKA